MATELFTTLPLILIIVFFTMGLGQKLLQNFGHDRQALPLSRGHESKSPDFARELNKLKDEEIVLLESLGVRKNLAHYKALGWVVIQEFKSQSQNVALLQNGPKSLLLTDKVGVISCLKKSGCD